MNSLKSLRFELHPCYSSLHAIDTHSYVLNQKKLYF